MNATKLLIAILIYLSVISCNNVKTRTDSNVENTTVVINKRIHDFDTASLGDTIKAKFAIMNTGEANLLILDKFKSCTCSGVSLSSNKVSPGDSIVVSMIVNTSNKSTGYNSVYTALRLNTNQGYYKFVIKGQLTN